MIVITSLKDGFRRCGLSHTGRKEYADDAFNAAELALLQAEPLLKVELITSKIAQGQTAKADSPDPTLST